MMAPPEEREPLAPDDETREPNSDEHVLRVLDPSHGDKRIKWKPKDSASVKKAKAKFEELRAKGYAFFRITKVRVKADEFPEKAGEIVATKKEIVGLEDGEQVRKFEVDTRETVAVPPRAGG